MWGKMFGRGNLLSQWCHILCESVILWRGGIFKRFPWVKNAAKIKHLCHFGDFAENSKSSTNFQYSEDVHEDLISSLGWTHPSTFPISWCNFGRTWCFLNKVSSSENNWKIWCIQMVLVFGDFVKYFAYPMHILGLKTLGKHYVPLPRFPDWKIMVYWMVLIFGYFDYLMYLIINQIGKTLGEHNVHFWTGKHLEILM